MNHAYFKFEMNVLSLRPVYCGLNKAVRNNFDIFEMFEFSSIRVFENEIYLFTNVVIQKNNRGLK